MNEIEWSYFDKIEMRTGTILEVIDFPEARNPAYKLIIDFGEKIGTRKSSAQITALYTKEELIGKQIMAVINFPKKQIGKFMSECLVTGFYKSDGSVVLAIPDKKIENGARLG